MRANAGRLRLVTMLANHSIKDLYTLALAEGEGMGTAYEYYVKRMMLARLLDNARRPRTVLIAGLPEKYGVSLDFVLLGSELDAKVTIVDDRPAALARLQEALRTINDMPAAPRVVPPVTLLTDLPALPALDGQFDLALSSEVLQRLTPDGRVTFLGRLRRMATMLALFCPNADNQAHNSRSGLGGLTLDEMRRMASRNEDASAAGGRRSMAGYIDMPPFPPGITRSAEQREEATSGRFEAVVMWGLGRYAHMERYLPTALRRRQSHIVYAFDRE